MYDDSLQTHTNNSLANVEGRHLAIYMMNIVHAIHKFIHMYMYIYVYIHTYI